VRAEQALEVTEPMVPRAVLVAIAIRLAQLMDTQSAVTQFSAAAKVLSEILGTLSRQSRRPGRPTGRDSLCWRSAFAFPAQLSRSCAVSQSRLGPPSNYRTARRLTQNHLQSNC
jgi:hypothetical protein